MTNIQQLQTNIAELQTQLNSIQEELNKLKVNKKWKPEFGEQFWYIDCFGELHTAVWHHTEQQQNLQYQNNCFQAKEQAEHHLECLKTKAELRELAEEFNGGVEIDWTDVTQNKFYINYSYNTKELFSDDRQLVQTSLIYCLNSKFLDKAIERIGEQRLIEMIKSEV